MNLIVRTSYAPTYVCFWHLADMQADAPKRLLLTHNGNTIQAVN